MEIRTVIRKGATELKPAGKLDIEKAESFELEFAKLLSQVKEKIVGLNLSRIEYIDSSGLGALIKALNAAKNQGISMILFGAPPKIQSIFQIARLEKFFTFKSKSDFESTHPSAEDDEMDKLLG
ncbi:MAG: STAS domain-containing protein [Leptospiraceae bacterium]|nr:STAS domain-containing protein [Leptospiraceae bacterium]